ncbi:MAG: hypothetical protein R2783_01470 [Gelidibacter sp.]
MKRRIFMYLFIFTALLLIFQYVNSKHILDNYEKHIAKNDTKVKQYKDSILLLVHEIERLKQQKEKNSIQSSTDSIK